MTLERQDFSIMYEATGSTKSFPFSFGAMSVDDIHLYDLNPGVPFTDPGYRKEITNATITPSAQGIRYGGTAYLSTLPASGHRIVITRRTPKTQERAYQNQKQFPVESVESALDTLTMIAQEEATADAIGTLTIEMAALTEETERLDSAKADRSELATTAAALQAGISQLQTDKADRDELNTVQGELQGAIQSLDASKADKTAMEAGLQGKLDTVVFDAAIQDKADTGWTQEQLDLKADEATVAGQMEQKVDSSTFTEAKDALEASIQSLDDAKLSVDHINPAVSPDPHQQYILKTNPPIGSIDAVGMIKVDDESGATIDPDGTLRVAGGSGESGTSDHRALGYRNEPGQHKSIALTHGEGENETPLNEVLDATAQALQEIDATVKTKADTTALEAAVASLNAAKAPVANGIIDVIFSKEGNAFIVAADALPTSQPILTLRGKAPADFEKGNVLSIDGTEYPLVSANQKELPAASWKKDSVITITIDKEQHTAFFNSGVGGADGWTIFPGLTPDGDSKPGLYLPQGREASLVKVGKHFEIASVKVKDIIALSGITFFHLENDDVWACGRNDYGNLGHNNPSGASGQTNLARVNVSNVKKVVASGMSTFFLLHDNTAYSCGRNNYGQLGHNAATGSDGQTNLTKIELDDVADISTSGSHTFFRQHSNKVYSCGWNNYGQLGHNTATGSDGQTNLAKVPLDNIEKIILPGSTISFLIQISKDCYACGYNANGPLGVAVSTGSEGVTNLSKVPISNVVDVKTISTNSSFFLLANGDVYSCGSNTDGVLGHDSSGGSQTKSNLARMPISNVKKIVITSGGSVYVHLLLDDGTVYNGGNNSSGNLGRAVATGSWNNLNFGIVPGLLNVIDIAATSACTYFLLPLGQVKTCGNNGAGQLARDIASGSATSSNLGLVTAFSDVKQIMLAGSTGFFLQANGDVKACGNNAYGQLGADGPNGSPASTNITSLELSNIEYLFHNNSNSIFAFGKDGVIYSWGTNNYGHLGTNVLTGTSGVSNLSQVPPETFGSAESLYEEGTLLLFLGWDSSQDLTPLYIDDTHIISMPISKVYQTQNGKDLELDFTIKAS